MEVPNEEWSEELGGGRPGGGGCCSELQEGAEEGSAHCGRLGGGFVLVCEVRCWDWKWWDWRASDRGGALGGGVAGAVVAVVGKFGD